MISAIVLTKNEEKNIKACLDALSWCDERLVVDDCSTDKTREIAERTGAKVILHQLVNFSDQRNFAIDKAKGDWLLYIDADERIPQALWYEIMEHINEPLEKYSGFYIKRIDVIWGVELKHGESQTTTLLRLAKKSSGKWRGDVHERWEVVGKKILLNNPMYHYPHPTIEEFLREINYYTDLRANELFNQKVHTNLFLIVLHTKFKFIQNYFVRLGFLDGLPGFISALLMSFHAFLVRAKLWMLWEKRK